MQDQKLLEEYCERGSWDKADTWLCNELVFIHSRIVRRRICCFVFFALLTAVLFCIAWVVIFPDCKGIETTKFPFFKELEGVVDWARGLVPIEDGGGNAVAILGALVLPFAVWGILSLLTCLIKPKKYAKKKTVNNAQPIKDKVVLLDNMYSRNRGGPMGIMCSFWLISTVIGFIMAMCASAGSENVSRYIVAGLVCAALYAACFFGAIGIVYRIYEERDWRLSFSRYDYENRIRRANGEPIVSYSDEDKPDTTFVLDEKAIKDILDDVYDDLSGRGSGNY